MPPTVGPRAAQAGVAVLVAAMTGLTLYQRAYLEDVGWSAVSRTQTEWPSVLATGPAGWMLSVAFLCGAVCMLILASDLILGGSRAISRDQRALRWVGVALLLTAIGLAGVAFPADPPDAAHVSWHAVIHNGLYPAIPVGVLLASSALAFGRPSTPGRSSSRVLLPLMVIFFTLTNVDAIAQLARYPAFACLMIWILALSAALSRQARSGQT